MRLRPSHLADHDLHGLILQPVQVRLEQPACIQTELAVLVDHAMPTWHDAGAGAHLLFLCCAAYSRASRWASDGSQLSRALKQPRHSGIDGPKSKSHVVVAGTSSPSST